MFHQLHTRQNPFLHGRNTGHTSAKGLFRKLCLYRSNYHSIPLDLHNLKHSATSFNIVLYHLNIFSAKITLSVNKRLFQKKRVFMGLRVWTNNKHLTFHNTRGVKRPGLIRLAHGHTISHLVVAWVTRQLTCCTACCGRAIQTAMWDQEFATIWNMR